MIAERCIDKNEVSAVISFLFCNRESKLSWIIEAVIGLTKLETFMFPTCFVGGGAHSPFIAL
ncbi:hypothetical protein [Paenibacillus sp. FSL A5-0031]|uniref:hypothetical protein n=1 Tax=Paenibacillus sp. FSL A5-0031 TaxID=1920420 RepID=UPI001185A4CB|nr:hypothetical protein [Paenibacillus sp. FSL A5-0031]